MSASPAFLPSPPSSPGEPPAFAASERLAGHFEALARRPATPAVLRHLLVHVEAALHADDRVALYEALWCCAGGLDGAALQAAQGLFDGRHRPLLHWLGRPLHESAAALAWAHLDGRAGPLFDTDAAFVSVWAARHGDGTPAWRLAAIRARIAGAGWAGLAQDTQLLDDQRACLQLAEQEPAWRAAAWCTAFELALAAGSEEAALQLLAACVQQGAHAGLPPALLATWLEAGTAGPLALAEPLQGAWLKPAALHDAAYRATLAAALRRPALRARCHALEALLGGAPTAAATLAGRPAWQALAALEAVYAAAERGEPVSEAAAPLLAGATLAPAARAALQRQIALEAIDRADPHAAAIALAAARAAGGHAQDAQVLQQLLLAIDEPAARAAAAEAGLAGPTPWLGARWQDEAPLWQALAGRPHAHLQPIAAYQLALLYTDGSLVPCTTGKTQQPQAGMALWAGLRQHPSYAALAERRLASPTLQLMQRAQGQGGGREHLWIPCADAGARRLLIVFACVESHHSHPQVAALAQAMAGHHLLFINNPELNWYSDQVFDEVAALIERRVLSRFAREDVSCYFGSMGGHAALKFALHFGFRALVFNPQVDLRLWAAFRPQQRALLLGARRHAQLQEAPLAQFERSPVCYLVGSSTADREAFSIWLRRVRECRHGSFIVEKSPDPHHAGLIARLVPRGQVVALLQRALGRLGELAAVPALPPQHAEVPAALLPHFWQQLDQAAALKLEILVRDGRVFVADSVATGTLAPR